MKNKLNFALLNGIVLPGHEAEAYEAERVQKTEVHTKKTGEMKKKPEPKAAVQQTPRARNTFDPVMSDLQSAVVMSEILGKPRAYRHRPRRSRQRMI